VNGGGVRQFFGRFDWALFAAMTIIIAIGIAFIWSGSLADRPEGSMPPYPRKQLLRAMIGLAVFLLALIPHYKRLENHAYPIYAALLAVLALMLAFGPVIAHSRRWIRAGPVRIQPSELMKIAFVLALARYLMYRKNYRALSGLAPPMLMTLLPMALILLEPDLGTALIFLPVCFVMLYAAGARARHLITLAVCFAGIALIAFFAEEITGAMARRRFLLQEPVRVLAPYQKARVMGFITGKSYQQKHSVIAVGSGRIFGKGWGRGTQNRYNLLPERHTDFIFAVIAEEAGMLGCLALLGLYFMIVLASFAVAAQVKDPFGRLVTVGLVTAFTVQVLINAAMALRLMPITGLTLPLVSYGGSSLVTTMLSISLIMNVKMHPAPTFARRIFEFEERPGAAV